MKVNKMIKICKTCGCGIYKQNPAIGKLKCLNCTICMAKDNLREMEELQRILSIQ